MDALDLTVLKKSAEWIAAGLRCELVTVIKTWGSSPRPEGAMLAICEDGTIVGSVSGGCIEDNLIVTVQSREVLSKIEIITYGISAEKAHSFGLPCGGTIELAIEPLHDGSRIQELLNRLKQHQLVARRADLTDGTISLVEASIDSGLAVDDNAITTIHGPRWRLLIIGAGQMTRFLAPIAVGLGYRVIVCDPRKEFRADWDIPEASLVTEMPDDVVIQMKPDARTAVIALTHDPKLDDLALMEALKSDAFYVGAIGSKVNNARRRERLKEHFSLSEMQVQRLHGPIGLQIGSKTPAEIAISVLAEMTAVRNRVPIESRRTELAHR